MLKVLELFGEIGAPRKALERLGIDFKVVDYVEINKYAVKSYNAIYDENFEATDISDWNKDIDVDMIFHGSPCQDFSLAGQLAGGEEGSGTRSSLLWETVRIVTKLKPKYLIWENVKNLLGKTNRPVFDKYIEALEDLGYSNYYQTLNTQQFGIPQNRERVFTVSIRNDNNKTFEFPKPIQLTKLVMDYLEDDVDDKFYLSDKMINYIVAKNEKWTGNNHGAFINKGIASCLNTGEGSRRCDASNYIAKGFPLQFDLQNNLLVKNATNLGYLIASPGDTIDFNYPTSETRRGRVQHQKTQTLTKGNNLGVLLKDKKIRRLIPLETWRLQGFDDESFFKAEAVCSNTQLYNQSGNSITVDVLEYLFSKLFNLDKLSFLIGQYCTYKNLNNKSVCKSIIKEIKPYTSKERFISLIDQYKNSEQYEYLEGVIDNE